jgi:ABC-type antimicrobial peptide transport system permease subunit
VRWLNTALHDTAITRHAPAAALMSDMLAGQYRSWRLGAQLFACLGALSLIIAGLGLYSVVSYLVQRRTHELAVRLALGARTADVVRLVLGEGLRLVALGVVLGAMAAIACGRFVASLLYGTSTHDPAVFTFAAVVLLATAGLASAVPTVRASRVNPLEALREE